MNIWFGGTQADSNADLWRSSEQFQLPHGSEPFSIVHVQGQTRAEFVLELEDFSRFFFELAG